MSNWQGCKRMLCIRPDNMGDLIMSGPAIRALKETFGAHITVLTSSMAKGIVAHMPEIDDAIIYDLPWVKTNETPDVRIFDEVINAMRKGNFDAAVIFTVYSQNPLPTAMLAYLAGIPRILAYCRENPYYLLTHWVTEKEPYETIKHQVRRDLDLVATIGAKTFNDDLQLITHQSAGDTICSKLSGLAINTTKPWIIMHAGVSEKKREYPADLWVSTAKKMIKEENYQILFTGSTTDKPLTDQLAQLTGLGSFSAGGVFNLDEFMLLVKNAPLIISVNTGAIHIAAAYKTPCVVLYAQTNPQHTPWNTRCKILPFSIPEQSRSKNEVIVFVNNMLYRDKMPMPGPDDIIRAIKDLKIFT
jgi:lipopolysaccharide heptosyltransferase II